MIALLLACAGAPDSPSRAPGGGRDYPEPRPIELSDAQPLAWNELFGAGRVHAVALRLDDEALTALARDPGTDQPAEVVIDNRPVGKGQLRMRGEPTQQSWSGKPSFRLDLPRDEDGALYAGTDEVVLDAMVDDPAQVRHLLASRLLAALGVLAPTTAAATLTVNGEDFGYYTLVEVVDEHFVSRHIAESGALWDGTDGADFDGEGLGRWEDTDPDDGRGDAAALAQVASLVRDDADDFYPQLQALVDTERLFHLWTGLAAVGHDDGFPLSPGDVYLFQGDDDPRLRFLPWAVSDGWSQDFDAHASESALGTRCLYDGPCAAALDAALAARRDDLTRANAQRTLDELLDRTEAAVETDPRRPFTLDEVRAARVRLGARVKVWPARLDPAP